ncbi:MAG: glycosyltransferase family 4 protein [Candidatus Brocadiia bacterium]
MQLQNGRPTVVYYSGSYGWGGSSQYMRRLVLGFPYDRYRLKLLFEREPADDLWNRSEMHVPAEWHFLKQRPPRQDSGPATEPRPATPRLPALLWRRCSPGELRLSAGHARRLRRLMGFFRRHPADIFHSFTGGCDAGTVAACLAGYRHRIASYNCLPGVDDNARRPANRLLEWAEYAAVDRAIVKTAATRETWRRRLHVPGRRFRVVYNGLDLERFSRKPDVGQVKRELGLEPDELVVGISARLAEMKGHKHLIAAVPTVLRRVPDAVFLIVGDGPLRRRLEAQAESMGLGRAVRFPGYREDIARITWAYDVAVLPSVSGETFGWALAEAMACSVPCVGSTLGPIAEVIDEGRTGLLAPVGDSEGLAGCIVRLLENPELRRRFGEAGRRRVEQKFTLRRMLDETFALYDGLLDDKSALYAGFGVG